MLVLSLCSGRLRLFKQWYIQFLLACPGRNPVSSTCCCAQTVRELVLTSSGKQTIGTKSLLSQYLYLYKVAFTFTPFFCSFWWSFNQITFDKEKKVHQIAKLPKLPQKYWTAFERHLRAQVLSWRFSNSRVILGLTFSCFETAKDFGLNLHLSRCLFGLMHFFETLEKQPCKQKTVLFKKGFSTKLKNRTTKLYCDI